MPSAAPLLEEIAGTLEDTACELAEQAWARAWFLRLDHRPTGGARDAAPGASAGGTAVTRRPPSIWHGAHERPDAQPWRSARVGRGRDNVPARVPDALREQPKLGANARRIPRRPRRPARVREPHGAPPPGGTALVLEQTSNLSVSAIVVLAP